MTLSCSHNFLGKKCTGTNNKLSIMCGKTKKRNKKLNLCLYAYGSQQLHCSSAVCSPFFFFAISYTSQLQFIAGSANH